LHVVGGGERIGFFIGNGIEDLLVIVPIAGSMATSLRYATVMMGERILCDNVKGHRHHGNIKK
jgi:hypothetical protein